MSQSRTLAELLRYGWEKCLTNLNKVFFIRPGASRQRVYQRRDLTPSEKVEIGNVLFPGRVKNVPPIIQSVGETASSSNGCRGSDVFVTESPDEVTTNWHLKYQMINKTIILKIK